MGNPDSDSLKQQTDGEKIFDKNKDDCTQITSIPREPLKNLVGENSLAIAQHFAPPLPPLPTPLRPSLWQTTHSIVTTITSIGGILYAVYWLWKTYIYPYLFGRRPKPKPIEKSIVDLESAVGACVSDVKSIRSCVETLAAAELTHGVVVTRLQEVKLEVNSLKALLLNRNQFPAVPTQLVAGSSSIPAWQLNVDETEQEREIEEEGTGSNGNTNGSDSSLEIVKDPNN